MTALDRVVLWIVFPVVFIRHRCRRLCGEIAVVLPIDMDFVSFDAAVCVGFFDGIDNAFVVRNTDIVGSDERKLLVGGGIDFGRTHKLITRKDALDIGSD